MKKQDLINLLSQETNRTFEFLRSNCYDILTIQNLIKVLSDAMAWTYRTGSAVAFSSISGGGKSILSNLMQKLSIQKFEGLIGSIVDTDRFGHRDKAFADWRICIGRKVNFKVFCGCSTDFDLFIDEQEIDSIYFILRDPNDILNTYKQRNLFRGEVKWTEDLDFIKNNFILSLDLISKAKRDFTIRFIFLNNMEELDNISQ